MTKVVCGEPRARPVVAAEQAAGQRDAGHHAQVLTPAGFQGPFFSAAIQAIVKNLNDFDTSASGGFTLRGGVDIAADGVANMPDLACPLGNMERLPQFLVEKLDIADRVILI